MLQRSEQVSGAVRRKVKKNGHNHNVAGTINWRKMTADELRSFIRELRRGATITHLSLAEWATIDCMRRRLKKLEEAQYA